MVNDIGEVPRSDSRYTREQNLAIWRTRMDSKLYLLKGENVRAEVRQYVDGTYDVLIEEFYGGDRDVHRSLNLRKEEVQEILDIFLGVPNWQECCV